MIQVDSLHYNRLHTRVPIGITAQALCMSFIKHQHAAIIRQLTSKRKHLNVDASVNRDKTKTLQKQHLYLYVQKQLTFSLLLDLGWLISCIRILVVLVHINNE